MLLDYHFPPALNELVQTLRKLPGVGSKGAMRFAFDILSWPKERQKEFVHRLESTLSRLSICCNCGCWVQEHEEVYSCKNCQDLDKTQLCIIAWPRQVFSIQATHTIETSFHVLGGLIDPLNGIEMENLRIKELFSRLRVQNFEEIILAFDTTLEGDATSTLLVDTLEEHFPGIEDKIRRPAFGIPANSSLDYIDTPTLAQAFNRRSNK